MHRRRDGSLFTASPYFVRSLERHMERIAVCRCLLSQVKERHDVLAAVINHQSTRRAEFANIRLGSSTHVSSVLLLGITINTLEICLSALHAISVHHQQYHRAKNSTLLHPSIVIYHCFSHPSGNGEFLTTRLHQ